MSAWLHLLAAVLLPFTLVLAACQPTAPITPSPALTRLPTAVASTPSDTPAIEKQAVQAETEQKDQVLPTDNKATEVVPDSAEDPGRAIADFDRAVELYPDDARAYYNRGLAYFGLGEHTKAIEDFNKAIELEPGDAESYHHRGVAYSITGDYTQAIQDYDKAIELNPDHVPAYINRGIAYGDLREYEKAIQDFTKAIEIDSGSATAWAYRGIASAAIDHYAQAVYDLEKYLKLMPDAPDREEIIALIAVIEEMSAKLGR